VRPRRYSCRARSNSPAHKFLTELMWSARQVCPQCRSRNQPILARSAADPCRALGIQAGRIVSLVVTRSVLTRYEPRPQNTRTGSVVCTVRHAGMQQAGPRTSRWRAA
jgi:hypothetical protein